MIVEAILAINPDAKVRLKNDDINTIEWLDGTTPISNSDILSKETELKNNYAAKEYQRKREKLYPTVQYQLDQLWHDINDDKLDKNGLWYTAIKKIKDDNPKE